jgi:ATP-dependent Clp protease ATP-binding subunit ClpC
MFERYTETARRVIFFSRYEASQFGSPYIETEHLLLGVLREARSLTRRFGLSAESIRVQIENATTIRKKVSTSVDLPLSTESKRVLAYAAEETELLNVRHIGAEHLFLGLLREEESLAADLLHEAGVRLETARKQIGNIPKEVGVGFGKAGLPRPQIEFLEDGQPLSVTVFTFPLPRIGEEVAIDFEGETKTYRVENIRFVLVADPIVAPPPAQQLKKIQVFVKRIQSP